MKEENTSNFLHIFKELVSFKDGFLDISICRSHHQKKNRSYANGTRPLINMRQSDRTEPLSFSIPITIDDARRPNGLMGEVFVLWDLKNEGTFFSYQNDFYAK